MLSKPILRSHAAGAHTLAVAVDVLIAGLIFFTLIALQGVYQPTGLTDVEALRFTAIGLAAILAWPVTLHELGFYESQRRRNPSEILLRLVPAAVVPVAVLTGTSLAAQAPISPTFPLLCGGVQALGLAGLRLVAFTSLRVARRQGRNYRSLLVIGSGTRAARVLDTIQRHPGWGLRVIGFVDEYDSPADPRLANEKIHKLIDFPELMRDLVVDEIVVACPRSMIPLIEPVVCYSADVGVPVTILSDLFGDLLPPPRVTTFESMPALTFAPVHHSRAKLAIKRAIDVVGASLLLAIAAPAIGIAALIIRATSPGPALFRHIRCGLNGRPIEMLKLRTMSEDAEDLKDALAGLNEMDGPVFKIANDPRVTPIGKVLRRWSLDELPQLWNVLKGDMSLVGPRPPVPAEVAQYARSERRRLSMRPGITCLWQVNGRNNIGFADWVKLDLDYIDNWTLTSDFLILLKTIPAVIAKTGAS